jgi:hypothetical protein
MNEPTPAGETLDERAMRSAEAFYERQLDRIASDLRRLADEVERHKRYTQSARSLVIESSYVVSEVHNCLPNLPISVLIDAARSVEDLRRGADQ